MKPKPKIDTGKSERLDLQTTRPIRPSFMPQKPEYELESEERSLVRRTAVSVLIGIIVVVSAVIMALTFCRGE